VSQYTITLTNPEGVAVTYDVPGKRAARKKARQLRFERTLHVGTVLSLPVPDEGITEVYTNVGGSTVWTWKTTPLETPKRAGRTRRPPKADLGELYRLVSTSVRVASALTAATGVECGDLDFSRVGLPWDRSDIGAPRLRFLSGGQASFTCYPDRFVEHEGWALAVRRGGTTTHTFALRLQDEVPSAALAPLTKGKIEAAMGFPQGAEGQ